MKRILRAFGLLAMSVVVLASVQPASAGSVTKTYEAATEILSISGADEPAAVISVVTEDGTLDLGAVRFSVAEYNSRRSVDIRVLDVVNPFGQVSLFACQDLDDDGICGEEADGITQLEDEPGLSGCLAGGLAASAPKLTIAGLDVSKGEASDLVVFISLSGVCPNQAAGGGTTGELRINFA